jgi:hypothetical protein
MAAEERVPGKITKGIWTLVFPCVRLSADHASLHPPSLIEHSFSAFLSSRRSREESIESAASASAIWSRWRRRSIRSPPPLRLPDSTHVARTRDMNGNSPWWTGHSGAFSDSRANSARWPAVSRNSVPLLLVAGNKLGLSSRDFRPLAFRTRSMALGERVRAECRELQRECIRPMLEDADKSHGEFADSQHVGDTRMGLILSRTLHG